MFEKIGYIEKEKNPRTNMNVIVLNINDVKNTSVRKRQLTTNDRIGEDGD